MKQNTILWIEPQANEQSRIRRLCKESELDVLFVSTGVEALSKLEKERTFGALVCSEHTDDVNCVVLFTTLRERFPHIQRVMTLDGMDPSEAADNPPASKQSKEVLSMLRMGLCQQLLCLPLESQTLEACFAQMKASSENEGPSREQALQVKVSTLEEALAEVKLSLSEMVDERTRQIEQAKKEWEQTFDAIKDPVLLIDQKHRILRANLALANTVKSDIRSVIGTACYKTMMGRSSPCPNCPMGQTLSAQKGQEAELTHEDNKRIFHLRSFPLSTDPPYVVHDYRDITEEKFIQQKLVQQDKLSSLGMLAGRVAHEINNPLAGILAQTQLLLLDVEDPTFVSDLKVIETAALRCRKIVQDLLDFSRQKPIDRGQRFDLNQIIQATLKIYALVPPKGGPELITDLTEDLPLSRVDPDKMQSVILNLLTNAKAATPNQGTIRLRSEVQGDNIVVTISDTGHGIPEEIKDDILMPFFTTKPPGLGTGLGLHIIHEAVKEHDGYLEIDSEVDVGSEFRIYLPVK